MRTYTIQSLDPATGMIAEWRAVPHVVLLWIERELPACSVLWAMLGAPWNVFFETGQEI